MILSSILNIFKKKSFLPAVFTEGNDYLINPGRGWYQIHYFDLDNDFDEIAVSSTLNRRDTIALVIVDIGKPVGKDPLVNNIADTITTGRDRPLSETQLSRFKEILSFFESRKLDIILRISYDHEGNAMGREPSHFDTVLTHFGQLLRVLGKYSDSVHIYQGLLLGNWGEMHGSRFISKQNLKQLFDIYKNIIGDDIFLSLRRPSLRRMLTDDNDFKTGIFDDGILASKTHLGSFEIPAGVSLEEESEIIKSETEYIKKISAAAPYGGEALLPGDSIPSIGEVTPGYFIEYLSGLGVSYLNRTHDINLLKLWKEIFISEDKSLYDYIGDHLGYRFFIKNACFNTKRNKGRNKRELEISIINKGFSVIYEEAMACVILKKEDHEAAVPVGFDFRKLKPGCEKTIIIKERLLLNAIATGQRSSKKNKKNIIGKADLKKLSGYKAYFEIKRIRDNRIIYTANRSLTKDRTFLGEFIGA